MSALTDFCEEVLDSIEKHHLSLEEIDLGLEIVSVVKENSIHYKKADLEEILGKD